MSSIVSSVLSSSVFTQSVVNEALENELILNMIFNNLDNYHLLKCRLVCTKWNRLSVKHIVKNNWTNKIELKLMTDEGLQDFIDTLSSSPNLLLFSCFSFQCIQYGDLNNILLKNFFNTFRNKIKSLYLDVILKDLEQLENIIESQATSLMELTICSNVQDYEIFSTNRNILKYEENTFHLSNLTYLCFEQHVIPTSGDNNVDEIEIQKQNVLHIQIMNWLLRKVLLSTDRNIHNSIPLRIYLKYCRTLRESVHLLKIFGFIKYLKMIQISSFKPQELNSLTNVGVELEILLFNPAFYEYGVDDGNGQMFTNEIYQCLQSQINSLELLDYEARVFKFPSVMSGLKILHLSHRATCYGDNVSIPLLYHEYFPNLEIFLLQSDDLVSYGSLELQFQTSTEFELQFLSPQIPCVSLKRLSIHYVYLNGKIMKKISTVFPQIKSLTVAYYPDYMMSGTEENLYSEIWNSSFAESLEELHLELDNKKSDWIGNNTLVSSSCCLKLNTLLSGVKHEQVRPLYKWLVFQNYEFDESKYNSILKLKNLEKLRIVSSSPQRYALTDFSAFCIFGNMKKLQVLHLDETLRRFSPMALEYLKNKNKFSPPVVSDPISRNKHEMYHPTDSNYYRFIQKTFNLLDDDDEAEEEGNTLEDYNNKENVQDINSGFDYESNSEDDSYSYDDDEKNNSEEHCVGEVSHVDYPNHSSKDEDIKSKFSIPNFVEFCDDDIEISQNELSELRKLQDEDRRYQHEINNKWAHDNLTRHIAEIKKSEDDGLRSWNKSLTDTDTSTPNSNETFFAKPQLSSWDATDGTMVILVTLSEHPDVDLTVMKFEEFMGELHEKILGYKGDLLIQCESCGLVSGKGVIRCMNEETVLWVMKTVRSMLNSEFRAFRVASPTSTPGFKRMWCYVETEDLPSAGIAENNEFLGRLTLQNNGLYATKWRVFLSLPSGSGHIVQLGVSEDSLEELIRLDFRPFYGIRRLTLRNHVHHSHKNRQLV